MSARQITIKDIAKALGYSTSTISRALRDSYEIGEETKKKIREYAEKMNYEPNALAVSLRKKKTKSIGVVVCSLDNAFFLQTIKGMDSVAYSKGYSLIIAESGESHDRELHNLKFLTSRGIDGLIISVTSEHANHDYLNLLHEDGIPMVLFDRIAPGIKTHCVLLDNFNGAYDATKHLLANGYQRIAALASSKNLRSTEERVNGYKKALIEGRKKIDEQYIRYSAEAGRSTEEIESLIEELLSQEDPPDALLTLSDRITVATLTYLKKKGMQIPADVGVIGLSNLDMFHLTDPEVTIIQQPAFEIGKAAAELIFDLIESKVPVKNHQKTILPSFLVQRASSVARGTDASQ